MTRILPPLLVLVILAVIAWRVAQNPQRRADRAWIESRWGAGPRGEAPPEQILEEVDRYVERYGQNVEDRWFAAQAYLMLGRPQTAAVVLLDDPRVADREQTARRLATLLLETMAFWGPPEEGPVVEPNTATLLLAQHGHDRAFARLEEAIRGTPLEARPGLFHVLLLQGDVPFRRQAAEWLRERGDPDEDLAAAILAMGPEPYPRREEDLARLQEVLDGGRHEQPQLWALAALALGSSTEPSALAALRARREKLLSSESPEDGLDSQLLSVALLAGGDGSALDRIPLEELLRGHDIRILAEYVETLVRRYQAGDDGAAGPLRDVWDALGRRVDVAPLHELRMRLADRLLLRGPLPRDDLPIDRMLAELTGPGSNEVARALAAAYRWRRGEAAAEDACVAVLRKLLERGVLFRDPVLRMPALTSPLLTAARALYLYDGSSVH